ncbi:MAG: hypothetical protein ACRDR6_02900 [Pseudonocardiaceae bacterium]
MAYGRSSLEVSAWVAVDDRCEINYLVFPEHGIIEFTLGGREELAMNTTEAGLRHCVAAFTSALDALDAARTQPDETHADLAPPADPATDRAG